ncbi:MAG: aminotransferase class V-fold PLP-dependent enzyme [Phycisphaerales bacterium]|nr:MAG: aminotransferase class V-fold PLP-dependent enzyme [Phycisphaerales bacterium]
MTPDEFRALGAQMVERIARYMEEVDGLPVTPTTRPGDVAALLPDAPPESPEAWDDVFADVERVVMPHVTHWQHPGFFGFFPCNATGPSILADMLSTGLGVQGMLWSTSPAATEIEWKVLDWLAQCIGLPECFRLTGGAPGPKGVIQGTASEALLACLIAARERARHSAGAESLDPSRCAVYASAEAHSSMLKAALLLGLPRENLRLIGVDGALRMRADALERAIGADRAAGVTPLLVCATLGTTSSGAVDPLPALGAVAQREGVWLHVDAAYAGAALVCPEHRWMIEGAARADSFNFNPHKWLLTSFDCSALWLRDPLALRNAMSVTPEYLRNEASDSGRVVDYRDWQIPLGRRFRSLKLWFTLRHYGVSGLRAHIEEHVRSAEVFESLVRADDRFEVAAPRSLSLVCFRLRGGDDRTRELHRRVNATREVFLTHTTLPPDGEPEGARRYVLRMAIGAVRTREGHVRGAWDVIRREAEGL